MGVGACTPGFHKSIASLLANNMFDLHTGLYGRWIVGGGVGKR